MHGENTISIWFFIGLSLLVNGALITGAGIYQVINPPEQRVVLFNLHANVWWGALLFLAGLVYCIKFAPKKTRKSVP
jgi:low temperature requirement protein LtrA